MPGRRSSLPLESLTVASRLDAVIEWGLYCLLAFLPLAFGAVEAWSELALYAGCLALSLLAIIRAVATGAWRLGSRVAWIAAGCLAILPVYAAAQALTLPHDVVAAIAPANAAAYDENLADLQPRPAEIGISLNRDATARRARLLAAAAALAGVVAVSFRHAGAMRRLLVAVFVIGLAEATLALAQIATFATQIYWTYGEPGGRPATAGSFVNYSHFAQFVNLTIGFGLALWLLRVRNSATARPDSRSRAPAWAGAAGWERLRATANQHAWLLGGLTIAALAVLTSMSRNGVLSLVIASAAVGTLLWRRGTLSWRGWALGAVPIALFVVLMFTALDDVYERLATLEGDRQLGGRWELTLGALRAWQAFPLWGVGADAHAVVFPLFDSSVSAKLAENADNDYAQWLEEFGVIGGVILAMLAISVATLVLRLMFRGRRSASQAAFGLGLGLLAVAIHSVTDFGQRIPAVFALTAVACGLLLALDRRENRGLQAAAIGLAWPATLRRALPACCLVAGVGGVIVWSGYRAYAAEQWWLTALGLDERIAAAPEAATEEDYGDLLAAAQMAAAWAPGNAEYGYWLNSHRWQTLQGAFLNPEGTTPDATALEAARLIAEDLSQVRVLAPTYGPPVALEGQIRMFALGEKQHGAELVRQAVRLAPYDPSVALIAGLLAAEEGRAEESRTLLDRAVQLAPGRFTDVASIYLDALDRPAWAADLASGDPDRLMQLAQLAEEQPQRADFAADMRVRAESILRQRAAKDQATATELASLAAIDAKAGNATSAETYYRRALGLDYGHIGWRLKLARLLAAQEKYEEAIRQARIVQQLHPRHPEATKLIGDWSVLVSPTGDL
ncbi:MAG: O-antigen ligase family protein [Planctomycetales bacterium]|nr:O-antigen ligase family protein [Planctomycetales bacterium]